MPDVKTTYCGRGMSVSCPSMALYFSVLLDADATSRYVLPNIHVHKIE